MSFFLILNFLTYVRRCREKKTAIYRVSFPKCPGGGGGVKNPYGSIGVGVLDGLLREIFLFSELRQSIGEKERSIYGFPQK